MFSRLHRFCLPADLGAQVLNSSLQLLHTIQKAKVLPRRNRRRCGRIMLPSRCPPRRWEDAVQPRFGALGARVVAGAPGFPAAAIEAAPLAHYHSGGRCCFVWHSGSLTLRVVWYGDVYKQTVERIGPRCRTKVSDQGVGPGRTIDGPSG